jgi:WD40 repeat protein
MSVRFSPNGQLLASGGGDDKVKIWNVSDGSLVRTIDFGSSNQEVFSVEFSPDGKYIAAADRDNDSQVRVWSVFDGALVRSFDNPVFASTVSNRVRWSPDGQYVVSAVSSGFDPSEILFWNFASGELVRNFRGESLNDAIRTLEFAPDGRTFAFSYGARVILAHNPFGPKRIRIIAHTADQS